MIYNILMYALKVGIAFCSLYNDKLKKMRIGEHLSFKLLKEKVNKNDEYLWFHAASLGEFEQGRPLIEAIRREKPQYKILLTFFSPSGYEVRKDYKGADIITYLPIDTPKNANRFIDLINPKMAFFIKYEFWYNYLKILKERNIPSYSISSIFRPQQVFFKLYGRKYSKVLNYFTRFYVQNTASKQLLSNIGINNVTVSGDTRFDRVIDIRNQSKRLPIVEAFTGKEITKQGTLLTRKRNNRLIFVAGSSWLVDEKIFLKYFNAHPGWKLIIAPHVISTNRLSQIKTLISKDKKVINYTHATATDVSDADVLIVDCIGLLSSIYMYGDLSYVGGGFGVGIHNVLEPAVCGTPVIFGPNNSKFAEARGLISTNGGFEIKDYNSFVTTIDKVTKTNEALKSYGQAAYNYVCGLTGATKKILSEIKL